jgi:hypothetical protein
MSRVYPSNSLQTNSPTNFSGQTGSLDLSILPGDYNDNGAVDAADYVVWRDNLNTTNLIPNDTTPEWVMDDDYMVWREKFGSAAGSAAGLDITSGSTTPEPATVATFLAGLITMLACGMRRRSV